MMSIYTMYKNEYDLYYEYMLRVRLFKHRRCDRDIMRMSMCGVETKIHRMRGNNRIRTNHMAVNSNSVYACVAMRTSILVPIVKFALRTSVSA